MNPKLIEKYYPIITELSNQYAYNSNITHLLYLIVPAFISKYSLSKENIILNTLKKTKIIISPNTSKTIEAYYTSIPHYQNNEITTSKYIIIQNYEKISLVQLLDNLVHELNHAINSYNQEIKQKDNVLYLRTGLTHVAYTLPNLDPLEKESSYILEEILNTNQTEEIINLIKNYHDPNHSDLNNTIYAINNETSSSYNSKSYAIETLVFKPILENKTFLSTLNNLRLSGDVEDIESWFDYITNIPNSYQKLNHNLNKIMALEKELPETKFWKNKKIKKIKDLLTNTLDIIKEFNRNCNYK
ncbi:MAG: hypothetical protein MR598_01815 [Erysipelotrichaceae bacterium]|nr:hypothetical protein [Erysipelotrichaceae bacterium]